MRRATHGHVSSPRLSPVEAKSPPFGSSSVGKNFLIFGSSGSRDCHRSELEAIPNVVQGNRLKMRCPVECPSLLYLNVDLDPQVVKSMGACLTEDSEGE